MPRAERLPSRGAVDLIRGLLDRLQWLHVICSFEVELCRQRSLLQIRQDERQPGQVTCDPDVRRGYPTPGRLKVVEAQADLLEMIP